MGHADCQYTLANTCKGLHNTHPCLMAGEGECWRRFKYGALIGSTVGGCIGLLFGTFAVLRYHNHPSSICLCKLGMVMEVQDSSRREQDDHPVRVHPLVSSWQSVDWFVVMSRK